MSVRSLGGIVGSMVAVLFLGWYLMASSASAQNTPKPPAKPKESGERVTQLDRTKVEPKDVTMTGRVLDLHCFMTGKFPTEDHAKCTADCLKAGVPAILETAEETVLLGKGMKGTAELLSPYALQEVKVKGKLHTNRKAHLKYLDIESIERAPAAATDTLKPAEAAPPKPAKAK